MSAPLHPPRLPWLRTAVVALAVAPLALVVPGLVDGPSGHAAEPAPTALEEPVPSAAALPRPILGFSLVVHHVGDLELYLESVDQIAAIGANALAVVTPMFQQKAESNEIRHLEHKCPTDEQLVAILQRARARGLRTMLQPIVLIEQPREKEWRGLIAPTDWDAWWASYERFIDRYVAIAEASGVDDLVIGSELNSTEWQLERWRSIAERVRQRFDGRLVYSANWDRFDKVVLWSMVDVMSVSAYFELHRDDPSASEDELATAWLPHREALLRAADRWKRPLLLGEIGYPSLPWASAHPWNYVAGKQARADHDAQARCWRAFIAAWDDALADPATRAAGFYCYAWDPYRQGDAWDTGYGVRGKPAAQVLREAMEALGE